MRGRTRCSALGVVAGGNGGRVRELTVGLVHHDEVGELHDPALEALQLVACAWRHEHEEQVDHRGDLHLRLADADRLDEHDVETRRLAQQHRFARSSGDATERSPVGDGRTNASGDRVSSSIRVLSPRIDPPLRVLDGSTASTATRCSRSTSESPSASMNVDFPAPGAPEIPTRIAFPAWGKTSREEPLGLLTVIAPRRLDQRDRARQRPPITLDYLPSELVHTTSLPGSGLTRDFSSSQCLPAAHVAPPPFHHRQRHLPHQRIDVFPATRASTSTTRASRVARRAITSTAP